MNLCVNAREAMPAGGELRVDIAAGAAADIRARADVVGSVADDAGDDFVCLSVTDSGRGVEPTDRRRIFEPFFSTKGVAEGRGLGLATVAAIVRQLGGCCGVDEAPGGGARFSVWLPVAHDPVAGGPAPAARQWSDGFPIP
jgi:two-component system cell cycle sensor histidine kinase/response regulator CckA